MPHYFKLPPRDLYEAADSEYVGDHATYTSYNYLGSGLIAAVKRAHFESSLKLTSGYFGRVNAIDFGCADGVMLPSLSRLYPKVLGIEIRPGWAALAQRTVDQLELDNTRVICNEGMSFGELAEITAREGYGAAYLLETLEHVGRVEAMYESRMEFLEGVFSLLMDDGVVAVSVPTMVGPAFLVQRLALRALGMQRHPIAARDLLAAGLLGRTERLEPRWSGDHLGFNHRKLEKQMRQHFRILRKRNLFFTQVYLVGRQRPT